MLASRHELRAIFPRDTARTWGWSELEDREYRPAYYWGVTIEGIDGPRSLTLRVQREHGGGARRFASLSELVQAGRAELCRPGMVAECSPASAAATVQDGAVVLTLRDSVVLARLVGLRPGWASVWHGRPEVPARYRDDSVRVEYVAPEVPVPDSALRAEAVAARRRYEESVNTVYRDLSAPGRSGTEVWMVAGDSATFTVEETRCRSDVCAGGYRALADSGWSVSDSSIVRLRAVPDSGRSRHRLGGGPVVTVLARRTGRTRVRVRGVTGPSDTLPSSRPVARELAVEVVVTVPVARVEVTPRIRTAVVGEPAELRVRAFDARGRVIHGAPVELRVENDGSIQLKRGPGPLFLRFYSPGRYTLTASFLGRTDTLLVEVAGAPREALRP